MRHDSAEVLSAIRVLLFELESQQLQYVVLGRQSRIAATLAGVGDLDILVAREDSPRAEKILLRQGFRHQAAGAQQGAVGDFVKWETGSGRRVQVQLHHELRLGFGVAPSFRIPTAGQLIHGSTIQGLVRTPSTPDHLVLHLVKGLLAWEATDLLAGARRHPFDSGEVSLLLPDVSGEDFVGSFRRLFPPLAVELGKRMFDEALQFYGGETDAAARLRLTMLSISLRDALASWSDRPLPLAWLRAARRRLARVFLSRTRQVPAGRTEARSLDSTEPMPAQ